MVAKIHFLGGPHIRFCEECPAFKRDDDFLSPRYCGFTYTYQRRQNEILYDCPILELLKGQEESKQIEDCTLQI